MALLGGPVLFRYTYNQLSKESNPSSVQDEEVLSSYVSNERKRKTAFCGSCGRGSKPVGDQQLSWQARKVPVGVVSRLVFRESPLFIPHGQTYLMDKHIPTLLVGWAMQEFNAMPQHYRAQEQDQPAPTLARTMTYLNPRISPNRNPRTARTEFKNLAQGEKEDIREFSRRVRSLGEIANATLNAATRDKMNREQFIDGLSDLEVQELLLREDPNTFNDAVDRALNIDAISRGSRMRQRRRLATTRFLQQSDQFVERHHVQAVSGQMEPDMMKVEMDEMKEQVKNQADMIKGMSEMMTKFVNSVILGPRKETTGDQDGNPRRLFNPYPETSRYGQNFASTDRKQSGTSKQGVRCYNCSKMGRYAREKKRTETEPFKLRRARSLQGFRREGFIPAENKQDPTNNRDNLNDTEAVNKLLEPRFLKPKVAVKGEPDKRTGSITVTGEVNGTPIEILVDTGTSTNMIRSSTFDQLKEPRKLMRYRGLLEAADGR